MRLWRVLPLVALLIVVPACTVTPLEVAPVEPAPSPANPAYVRELEKFRAEIAETRRKLPDVDKSAQVLLACDRLGFTPGGEGHRLCVLRGVDRLVK